MLVLLVDKQIRRSYGDASGSLHFITIHSRSINRAIILEQCWEGVQ